MPAPDVERIERALQERVKELTCLYGIARVTQRPGLLLSEALQAIVELLPPAWQYSDVACARIVLDTRAYITDKFREGLHHQSADIIVKGALRGMVEVVYTQHVTASPESPFLQEEASLIDMIAREVALFIERTEAEEYNSKLQEQLRHADRLATIGQLAAGVAHDMNEPLANILGFAQLAKKTPEIPKQAAGDLDKIVDNCLHAREVIRKLLTFARQAPPQAARVNINQVVTDGLYFLESRCTKAGVEVVRRLDPNLPEITADPSQLHQVLVNLVVNAVQAMPEGGKLTIETRAAADWVSLSVQDTGIGMSEEVQKNIFTPFFTTKDASQGTGLGLAVIQGIVASHGGKIRVKSELGSGAFFEIELPVVGPGETEESAQDGSR
jgi:signal transduction histidine kinase